MTTPYITQLPDGAGIFTANVMTKEEALKLPVTERPICFRISHELYSAVFETVGGASMCWQPKPGSAVFDSERAASLAAALCFKIAEEIEKHGTTSSTPVG